MKLRPSPKDRKAIDKLKTHYLEATSTKAILRAVYEVPELCRIISDLNEQCNNLNRMLDRAAEAQGFFLDGIEGIKRSRKEIEKD